MKRQILPVLDARGVIVAWKDAPRRIHVKAPMMMFEECPPAPGVPMFAPGMLLRVTELDEVTVSFEVLTEGER